MPRNDLIKLSSRDVRQWYNDYCCDIPDQIDQGIELLHKARQACLLRNTYKQVARDMMENEEERTDLEEKMPIRTFEQILELKKQHHKLRYEEALKSIIESSQTTNEKVNERYGIDMKGKQ